jgi:hypothetical protein
VKAIHSLFVEKKLLLAYLLSYNMVQDILRKVDSYSARQE